MKSLEPSFHLACYELKPVSWNMSSALRVILVHVPSSAYYAACSSSKSTFKITIRTAMHKLASKVSTHNYVLNFINYYDDDDNLRNVKIFLSSKAHHIFY